MENLIHYTSRENWEAIQKDKVLWSKTMGIGPKSVSDRKLTDQAKEIIGDRRYLVGIPEGFEDAWKEEELLEYLKSHTKGEVKLKVPIMNKGAAFIRDHSLFSPKFFKENRGEDLFESAYRGQLDSFLDLPAYNHAMINYKNTATRFFDYEGNFKCPEIWVPQDLSCNMVEVLK